MLSLHSRAMADKSQSFERLAVLRDDPLFQFAGDFDPAQDAFNHEAYAEAIHRVICQTAPPLSIGLFGPWGIGKSTVINILFKLIARKSSERLKPVYFNAWKYSGDSFRRQFLIEVARQVYEGEHNAERKVKRIEQLNYTEVLKEKEKKGITQQVWDVLSLEVRFREAGLARLILAAAVIVIGGVLALLDHTVYPLLAAALPALLLFLLKLKFEDVFIVRENPAYDPKLIFPEQFEHEFRALVAPSGPLGTRKAVIAIDDIDRCEPDIVRDILVSIKTFLGQEDCFFIVPCDERAIVKVFQDPDQQGGYQTELLRKYFNVGVRMTPIMATDLAEFANNVSRQTGIPPSVVQVAILANYRDARKMKHFLNSFAVKREIAKARYEKGFMPFDVDKNLAGFAKAVLIEDLYPDVFEKIVQHPEAYDVIESLVLRGESSSALKRFGLDGVLGRNPGLQEILERTRDTKIEHIEVFLSLKTTNPEARIPHGFELKNAILLGDTAKIDEVVSAIQSEDARLSLGNLIVDLLEKMDDSFLKNAISATFQIYQKEGAFVQADRERVASSAGYALLHRGSQKALAQNALSALQCVRDARGPYAEELWEKYLAEIDAADEPPDNLPALTQTLYEFGENRNTEGLSVALNKRFEAWTAGGRGLEHLAVFPPELQEK
jgi:hypothetical protein